MKVVIGTVGEPLAGKETAGKILAEYFVRHGLSVSLDRFSDILRETLELWSIEISRQNLQKLARVMRGPDAFGDGALASAVKNRFLKREADIVIADGVRWPEDEALIRSMPRSAILYVTASPETRYARIALRSRDAEAMKTREEFLREERAENEVHIPYIGARADWKIVNEGTPEELEAGVREFWETKVRQLLGRG